MPYETLRSRLLAARERRQALLARALVDAPGAVVMVSLNIPGAIKAPAGSGGLFAEAVGRLREALPAAQELRSGDDALGPFSLFRVPGDPVRVKAICVAIESASRRARLFDLDVYSLTGVPIDRASLGLAQRACLVCDRPAHECARTSRHDLDTVIRRADALLSEPGL
jgi:holo-ACP synthase